MNDVDKSLAVQTTDYVVSAAKAALGAVPFAGSLLSELAGTIVPNQRIDRIVKIAKVFDQRLAKLEQQFVLSELRNEEFSDLLEEGLRQAAHSLSEERREYISSLISSSLSSEDIAYQESKHLLRILDEINDVEIIWLRFFLHPIMGGDEEFRSKHKEVLKPISRVMGASQTVLDKGTLQESYKEHLIQLNLLERKDKSFRLTSLGRLLLREIGFEEKA
jgi:oligoendopeptidase F